MFKRKLETPWSDREKKCFRSLTKSGFFIALDDLALMERYYEAERKKGDKGVHRRDLYTLIFNWQPELDRARAWEQKQPIKNTTPKKYFSAGSQPSDAHREKCHSFFHGLSEQLRSKFKPPEPEMSGAEIEARACGLQEEVK